MTCLPYARMLLAEQSRWENLSQGLSSEFRERQVTAGDVVIALLILAGIAVAVWFLSRLLPLGGQRRARSSPGRLFLSLCTAHRLRWREYWWLWRLARSQRLRDPARLFLEPERWEAAGLSPALRVHASQLTRLRERLFAEPPPKEQRQPADARTRQTSASPPANIPLFEVPTVDPGPVENAR